MHQLLRALLGLALALLAVTWPTSTALAAEQHALCTAELVIFTTSNGTVTTQGNVTHARNSGVGGSYVSGFLSGYWEGQITAQLTSNAPPTFHATDRGPCHPAPVAPPSA